MLICTDLQWGISPVLISREEGLNSSISTSFLILRLYLRLRYSSSFSSFLTAHFVHYSTLLFVFCLNHSQLDLSLVGGSKWSESMIFCTFWSLIYWQWFIKWWKNCSCKPFEDPEYTVILGTTMTYYYRTKFPDNYLITRSAKRSNIYAVIKVWLEVFLHVLDVTLNPRKSCF